jgi:quinol monooxygenase YgiN
MIHVIATVELNPGTRDKFLAEFRKIVADVKAEAGCIEYGPAVDAETGLPNQFRVGADRLVIVEKWESIDHLKAHMTAPHMLAYRPKVKEFVKGMELRVLSPV